jgi:hypothetical protein
MLGKGFFIHLGKDNFEVTDVGNGRDLKKFKVKMLKRDMQEILKKYGRDNTGKKDEVLQKFITFMSKAPKIFKPKAVYKAGETPAVPVPSSALSKIGEAEARVDRMLGKLKTEPIGPIVSVEIPEDKPPTSAREIAKAVSRAPTPSRPRYKHRFSDVGYNADRYTEDEILRLLADPNSPSYETEEQRQIKRLTFNKIVNENRKKNKNFIGNWIVDGELYNSKTGNYSPLNLI